MSDDQDGCEWVNVSSGTSTPDQRPLNGCVCVGLLLVTTKSTVKTAQQIKDAV